MKRLFILMITILNSIFAFSQANLGCATESENIDFTPFTSQNSIQNCSKTSSDWLNHFRLPNSYKPTATSYIGIKTIPINMVIFGEDDGSLFPFHIGTDMPNMATYYDMNGIEIPNPYTTTSQDVDLFEAWINRPFQNPEPPLGAGIYYNGPGPEDDVPYSFEICNPSSLPDSKIRFIINHFYFYKNKRK